MLPPNSTCFLKLISFALRGNDSDSGKLPLHLIHCHWENVKLRIQESKTYSTRIMTKKKKHLRSQTDQNQSNSRQTGLPCSVFQSLPARPSAPAHQPCRLGDPASGPPLQMQPSPPRVADGPGPEERSHPEDHLQGLAPLLSHLGARGQRHPQV